MYQSFDSMPGDSRVWIYQANRLLTPTEKIQLEAGLQKHCEQWSAHSVPLQTSFTIQYDLFAILAVDEQQNGASGCSIDSSVHFLQGIQQSLAIDFFDRTQVAFLEGNNVQIHSITRLKTLFENHTLSGDSIAFNPLTATKSEWAKNGLIRVKDSWLSRYLPKRVVVDQ